MIKSKEKIKLCVRLKTKTAQNLIDFLVERKEQRFFKKNNIKLKQLRAVNKAWLADCYAFSSDQNK